MQNERSKDWVFTINNYSDEDMQALRGLVPDEARYLVFGREVAPESGTPHLQGFVQLLVRVRRGAVSRMPGFGRAALFTRRGSVQEAAVYCKKENDFEEFGTPTAQGKRKDLEEVKEAIDSGANTNELWDNHFANMVRYSGSFQRYRYLRASRDPGLNVKVYVLWGPTGVGKSRFPRLIHPDLFSVPDVTLQWWDGYDGQSTILLDDFDGKSCPVARFLRYLDRYNVQVPVKGGFVPLLCSTIWISSNTNPDDWFPEENQTKRDAVRRRFARVVHVWNSINFDNPDHIQGIKDQLSLE